MTQQVTNTRALSQARQAAPTMPAPAPAPASARQLDLHTCYQEAKDWQLAYERALAAYNHLNGSYQSALGQVADGERRKGLPIFSFRASPDGVNVIECAMDLKRLESKYLPHVLIPMINLAHRDLQEAYAEWKLRVDVLEGLTEALLHPQPVETEAAA